MHRINQKGFGVVGIILVILILAVIGGVGYYVFNSQKDKDSTPNTSTAPPSSSGSANSTIQSTSSEYLEFKEWGIKIGVGQYLDKVSIDIPEDFNSNDFAMNIRIKPEFSAYKDCKTGITITRLKELPSWFKGTSFKVGDYYYYKSNQEFSECDPAFANKSTEPGVLTGSQLSEQFNSLGIKAI